MVLKPSEGLFKGHRPRNGVALYVCTAELAQHGMLACRFHTFSQRFEPEPLGHRLDRGDHALLFLIFVYACYKGTVDLDPFDLKAADCCDGGVASAEIIKVNAAPHLCQCCKVAGCGIFGRARHNRFKHFDCQPLRREVKPVQIPADFFGQPRVAQLFGAEVDRHAGHKKPD